MASPKYLPLLLFMAFVAMISAREIKNYEFYDPTAYELLMQLNFPIGLLPRGVQSYLFTEDGSFEVFLSGTCEFKVAGKYLLKYKRTISGTVESGTVKNLKGVSVKILFVWVPITEVDKNGDELTFHIGPFSKTFPVSDFDESPICRAESDYLNGVLLDF
ncbi:hypothetical protein LUZ60_004359 [Juncus effusus]|nr:hypothetical protein LUZ60_004359 [Juncus effusus]